MICPYTRLWTIFISIYWSSGSQSVAVVRNVSVMPFNMNSIIINGTCNECLCAVLLNKTEYSSFNCFLNNNTCEIFCEPLVMGTFVLNDNIASSFYFFSWPIEYTIVMTDVITTATTLSYEEYMWTFDSIYQDLSSTFNGIPMNGLQFSSSTITGYGSSLSLSSSFYQMLLITTPFLNLYNRSWTFEAWIYPSTLLSPAEQGIIVQCQAFNRSMCLHLLIRQEKLYMGFYGDDLSGVTSLVASRWYHIAFVFDSVTLTQSIYLDGILDSSRTANSAYQGSDGYLTFGTSFLSNTTYFFDGLIDQLYFIARAKIPAEILDDATLTVYFPFDNGLVDDRGPLRINGSLFGSTSVVGGRVGDALHFGSSSESYFGVSGLVLLGISNRSYSMSIWINPTIINNSTILHVSSDSDGLGWCVGMLSLSSSGHLIAFSYDYNVISVNGPVLSVNNWTHVAITYSSSNGLRLYVQGTLHNSSIPFQYIASGVPNYLFLGTSLNGSCIGIEGQFIGALDEFRLYSRELTASDVSMLSQV